MTSLLCESASIDARTGLSFIDSLECDGDLDSHGMRDTVNALILAEMETMAAEGIVDGDEYLARAPLVPPLRVSIVPGNGSSLDTTRYGPPTAPPIGADAIAWEAAASRAALAVESLEMRTVHLELASRYGVDVWRTAARDASASATRVQDNLQAARASVAEIEASRANALRTVAPHLFALDKRVSDSEINGNALAAALAGATAELDRVKRLRRA